MENAECLWRENNISQVVHSLKTLLCLVVLCATKGFIKDPRAPSIIQLYNKLSSQFFNADEALLVTVKFLASNFPDFKRSAI